MVCLEAKEIEFAYKDKKVINGVSFKLQKGVNALLGPNGAGKTTLINILLGLYEPQGGEVVFDGEGIRKLKSNYYDHIGYMPQMPGIYENYTAYEFLMYMANLKGIKKKERKNKVETLLEKVNLLDVKNSRLGTFSGGMKQRIGIAQALLNDPDVLILDEPTAGLDPLERIRLKKVITEIATNRIVVFATHIVPDIESIAKQVLILDKGKIIKNASTTALLKEIEDNTYSIIIEYYEELDEIKNEYLVSNVREKKDGKYEVDIISKEKEQMQLRNPSLEDVFLINCGEKI